LIGATPLIPETNHGGKKTTKETRHEVPQLAQQNRQEQCLGEAGKKK
jgi:hypothetical protein